MWLILKAERPSENEKLCVSVRYAAQQLTNSTPSAGQSAVFPNTYTGFPQKKAFLVVTNLMAWQQTKGPRLVKCESNANWRLIMRGKPHLLLPGSMLETSLLGKMCVMPLCEEEACGRCLNCSPGQYLCESHIDLVHARGRSLHHREVWKVSWRFMQHPTPASRHLHLFNQFLESLISYVFSV